MAYRPLRIRPRRRYELRRRDLGRWLAMAAAAGVVPSLGCDEPTKPHGKGAPETQRAAGKIHDVVIVGAGLSGLSAAHMMSKHDILVLEKEKEPGGRIRSDSWENLRFSLGAAYMGKPTREMKQWFRELGLKAIPVPPPGDAIAYQGKVHSGWSLPALVGDKKACRDFARVGKELMKLAEQGIDDAVYGDLEALAEFEQHDRLSVEAWLKKQRIHPLVQRLIDVENRGLFGVSNSDMSFLFDIPEMAFDLYDPDTEAYCDAPQVAAAGDDEESSLYTFPKGMSELVWAIEKRLGAKLQKGADVTRVAVGADKTVTVSYRQGGKARQAKAYAAVLATPAPVTAAIVKSGLSAKVMQALRSIRYTSYVTMALFLSERVWRGAWNLACLDTCFTTLNDAIRTQVPLDYQKKGILGVALPPKKAAEGAALIRQSDEQLLAMVLADAKRYFPGLEKKIRGKKVHRFKHAFPVFRPGYGRILWDLHHDASTRGPLFLAGDYMVYPTLGGAAVSAENAYERVEAFAETIP